MEKYIISNFKKKIIFWEKKIVLSLWNSTLGYDSISHNLYFKVSSWKSKSGQSILYVAYTTFQIAK